MHAFKRQDAKGAKNAKKKQKVIRSAFLGDPGPLGILARQFPARMILYNDVTTAKEDAE